MSIPAWPATLPTELLAQGYGEAPGDNRLRSPMEVGPPKVRRRATSSPRKISGNVLLTEDQLDDFKTFYDTTLLSGTLRFTWNDPTAPTIEVEMRFDEIPSWVVQGVDYNVSMTLEILP